MTKEIYKIKPIKSGKGEKKKSLGWELFPELSASIYFSATTKSGKTTNINHVIQHCIGKNTIIYFFVSTIEIDPTYKEIIKSLDKRGIQHYDYPHFIDEDGVNIVDGIIEGLSKKDDDEEEEKDSSNNELKPAFYNLLGGGQIQRIGGDEGTEKKKKPNQTWKYNYPRFMFIFDDLGNELRNKSIYQLLLKQRHYKAKTILSSQYINNLTPQSINQLDYVIIYGGHNQDQIKELYKKLDLSIPLIDFIEMYEAATEEKYNFLWIDRRNMILKKNYDVVLNV